MSPARPDLAQLVRVVPDPVVGELWWVVCGICGNALFVGYYHRKADADRAARKHRRGHQASSPTGGDR